MRRIVILFILIIEFINSFAQHKKNIVREHHASASKRLSFHIQKDNSLIRNINNLQYDSVMIFTFGCSPLINLPKKYKYKVSQMGEGGGFMLSEGLVDSTQHWLPLLSDTGKILSKGDIGKILTTLKSSAMATSRINITWEYLEIKPEWFLPSWVLIIIYKAADNKPSKIGNKAMIG